MAEGLELGKSETTKAAMDLLGGGAKWLWNWLTADARATYETGKSIADVILDLFKKMKVSGDGVSETTNTITAGLANLAQAGTTIDKAVSGAVSGFISENQGNIQNIISDAANNFGVTLTEAQNTPPAATPAAAAAGAPAGTTLTH